MILTMTSFATVCKVHRRKRKEKLSLSKRNFLSKRQKVFFVFVWNEFMFVSQPQLSADSISTFHDQCFWRKEVQLNKRRQTMKINVRSR